MINYLKELIIDDNNITFRVTGNTLELTSKRNLVAVYEQLVDKFGAFHMKLFENRIQIAHVLELYAQEWLKVTDSRAQAESTLVNLLQVSDLVNLVKQYLNNEYNWLHSPKELS